LIELPIHREITNPWPLFWGLITIEALITLHYKEGMQNLDGMIPVDRVTNISVGVVAHMVLRMGGIVSRHHIFSGHMRLIERVTWALVCIGLVTARYFSNTTYTLT
jgi:hypothetical protein